MVRAAVLAPIASLTIACGAATPSTGLPPLEIAIDEVRPGAEQSADADEIRRSVTMRAEVDHSDLPPAVREGEPEPGAWPRVVVQNDTPYGMVVWVSGPCARTLALPAMSQNEAEICAGEYQLAAQLSRENVLPLVGEGASFDDGFRYTFTFYVRGDRRVRRRRQ